MKGGIERLEFQTSDGKAIVFVGLASAFRSEDGDQSEYDDLEGKIASIEWFESSGKGKGSPLMVDLLDDLKRRKVKAIVLQVVPPRAEPDSPEVKKVIRFYQKFGFVLRPDLKAWSDYPMMLLELD
jgi:hypothetical protein